MITEVVDAIVAASMIEGAGAVVPVDVQLPSGSRLVGAVPDLYGNELRRASYGRLSGRERLLAWVRLLALSASSPERSFAARSVGRSRTRDKDNPARISIATIGPLGDDPVARRSLAESSLEVLIDLYRRGAREPLPLYPKTSLAWAEAVRLGTNPKKAALKTWQSKWHRDLEDKDRRHQEVLGGVVSLEELLTEGPRADEEDTGWAVGEPSRLGRYACRLWDGLLAHERVEER